MSEYSESNYETYDARADAAVAMEIGEIQSPFHIEVRFLGGLTESQKQVFKDAADRWTRLIVGDLPDAMVSGELIDDLVIEAQGAPIDGVGGVLGQAGPRLVRPRECWQASVLADHGHNAVRHGGPCLYGTTGNP
jgi:hypothetical protein